MSDAEKIEALWRASGLPEYFLGNGGTNHNLYKFADALRLAGYAAAREQAVELGDPSIIRQHGALASDPWEAAQQVTREYRNAIRAMEPNT